MFEMVLLSSSLLFLIVYSISVSLSAQIAQLPHCTEDSKQSELIFVSTLDGKFSALTASGQLSWQIDTGPGSLLSSNIHQLELSNNGQWIRIIPSLSGSLYKFNGATIDPIPISADSLLTSSFKYLDDLAVAGGREVRTYGVALNTGQLLYECSFGGCQNITDYSKDVFDVIIVERKTHTVRAVEPRTGVERWNFTVGQHNIKIPYLSCVNSNMKGTNINISTVLPEGLLSASQLDKPFKIIWQHKFGTPIVAIWRWDGREVTPLNLFSSPAIMVSRTKAEDTPSIYVGMHNKQLYIHESTSMKNILHLKQKVTDRDSVVESQSLAKIPWKPVPAVLEMDGLDSDTDDSTALSVLYASEYVNGNGFYLYTDEKLICGNNVSNTTIPQKMNNETIWNWWKEALVILCSLFFVFNVIFTYKLPRSVKQPDGEVVVHVPQTENDAVPYTSRYMSEFDPIACLGKGGFGVVFQAKKKFDECEYAIKRITLPKREAAKDRMMREVKALAKLDHRNIVRYYNAWLESPPYDWQVSHDRQLLSDFSSNTSNNVQSHMFSNGSKNLESQRSYETGFFDQENKNGFNYEGSSIVFESGTNPTSFNIDNVSHHSERRGSNSFAVSISPVYLYIQMQLCCKQSLKDWLSMHSVRDRNQSMAIFGQIVEAVEYVHFRRLIHRDLKPSNIFFSLEGQIKIGDFGLVTSIKEYDADDVDDYCKVSLKKSHTNAVGTHLYMSPEQLNAQQYDSKVDIYSLGIILFELLVAFSTEMERINVLSNVRQRKYPKEFSDKIAKEFSLLNSMLASNPKERPTATGIREWLCLDDSNKLEDSRFDFNLPTSTFMNTLVN